MKESTYQRLIQWSQSHFSDLPWRHSRTLYTTLVSEIMLQQTTVKTVMNRYGPFLARFPDLDSLAQTNEEEMMKVWKGLGYYRRAKNLLKAAQTIIREHEGNIPLNLESLKKIPGIGDYTARAILAIGADRPALALDANLERVLARFFALKGSAGPALRKKLQTLFEEQKIFFPREKFSFRRLSEGLMDLGREICQASSTDCQRCPLGSECQAFRKGKPRDYPRVIHPPQKHYELSLLRLLCVEERKICVYQKQKGEWLEGQWELPTLVVSCQDPRFRQYPTLPEKIKVKTTQLKKMKSAITRYKITNYILILTKAELKTWLKQWGSAQLKMKEIKKGNFTTTTLKILKREAHCAE